ncbi:MAG: tetraacyldisaccharide 4'-kinase [Nitrospirota bacterium]
MVFWVYNALLIVTSPLWGVWLAWRLAAQRKDRRGFAQRWRGLNPGAVPAGPERQPRIWIHAVSVGEAMAVAPLVRALRRRWPRALLVGSTVTDLGQETMRAKAPELDLVCYLPFDLWWPVRRAIRAIRPTLFLFAEMELWPNLLLSLQRAGVPSALVNGRISERSARRYRWAAPFIRRVIGTVDALAVQAEADRERFIRLGADPSRVAVCGNLKADACLPPPAGRAGDRQGALGADDASLPKRPALDGVPLIVAGSTHPSEEAAVARAFLDLLASASAGRAPRLCLAPRHLDRCDAVEEELRRLGLNPLRRSRWSPERSWDNPREVLVLDTMGELTDWYRAAAVTVMGGTLAPIGGHNMLEPAAAGCPVIIGPHAGQWSAIADGLAAAGGAIRVQVDTELAPALRALLSDGSRRARMGEAARGYVASQQGATGRTIALIDRLVAPGQSAGAEDVPRAIRSWRSMAAGWLNASGGAVAWVKALLRPAAWAYGSAMALRRTAYRRGWLAAARLPVPVISVGNLTVGGSGKTPMVMALAHELQAAGRPVGILSRGYRGRREQDPLLVSDGRTIRADARQAGDEALLLARRLAGAPVAVGSSRAEAGRLLLDAAPKPGPGLLVLDDGFQHLALHRDVNLLLIDEGQPTGNGDLLPCGPLRERWSAARDASAVVLVRRPGAAGEAPPQIAPHLRRRGFAGPLFSAMIEPIELTACRSGEPAPLAALAGARVAICSGIARPHSFRQAVAAAGALICDVWLFEDHHDYTRAELDAIARRARERGAAMVVTTEKDGVKWGDWPEGAPPAFALRLGVRMEPEREWREWLASQTAAEHCAGTNGAVAPLPRSADRLRDAARQGRG